MKKIFYLIFFFCPALSMAVRTWVGPATITEGAWNTAANWSPATMPPSIPNNSEQIIFNTSVSITENVPVTAGNDIRIQFNTTTMTMSTFTIAGSVSIFNAKDLKIEGGSTFINNGTATFINVTYPNIGGSITNNGSLSVRNLNIGNTALTGSFTNNGILTASMDIVIEEGTFDNNPGASVNTVGLDIRSGGTLLNGGNFISTGATSTAKVYIADGGILTNEAGGSLLVDYYNPANDNGGSNVIPIEIQGGLTNLGTITIGHNPDYNPGAKGIKVGSSGDFLNEGNLIFNIDPANCVIIDNSGANGSFVNNSPITIHTGMNCLNSILPILISALYGQSEKNYNTINWTLESSAPLDAFELERSMTGSVSKPWLSIYQNKPNETGEKTNFSYKDFASGTEAYYRLKLIDQNGGVDYSEIIKLQNKSISNQIRLFPLPANQSIYLGGQIPAETSSLQIVNMNGVTIKKFTYDPNLEIQISNIPNGLYFLMLSNQEGKTIERLKFIKAN